MLRNMHLFSERLRTLISIVSYMRRQDEYTKFSVKMQGYEFIQCLNESSANMLSIN